MQLLSSEISFLRPRKISAIPGEMAAFQTDLSQRKGENIFPCLFVLDVNNILV
jgi:hypothetical protein